MGQACEAEGKLKVAENAHVETEQRLKDSLFHLVEVEKYSKMLSLLWLVLKTS